MNVMQIEVITPDEQVYTGEVRFILARATDGDIGILPGHAPLIASLSVWPVRLDQPDGKQQYLGVHGGFMEVTPTHTSIVTPMCELPEQIDVKRAEAARDRAVARLNSDDDSIDKVRAKAALDRAEVRLKLAIYAQNH